MDPSLYILWNHVQTCLYYSYISQSFYVQIGAIDITFNKYFPNNDHLYRIVAFTNWNNMKLWIVFASLWLVTVASNLKPEFGVTFHEIGRLQPSSDYFYVTINFKLPIAEAEKVMNSSLHILQCDATFSEQFTNDICSDFVPVVTNFQNRENQLKVKLSKHLKAIGTITENHKDTRTKRFVIVLALSVFFTAGFKAVNAYLQYKRTKSVKNAIAYIDNRQNKHMK